MGKPKINEILGKKRDVAYPPMDRLLKIIPNRYILVNIIARRARDLTNGIVEPLVECDPAKDSPIDIAIAELLSGQIQPELPTHSYRELMEYPEEGWIEVRVDEE